MGWAAADRTPALSSDTGTAPRHRAAFGTGAVVLRRGCVTAAARDASPVQTSASPCVVNT